VLILLAIWIWEHPSSYMRFLAFASDLIIELGRRYSNSTCVFTQAANELGNTEVLSEY
jgi:hypothetical protein